MKKILCFLLKPFSQFGINIWQPLQSNIRQIFTERKSTNLEDIDRISDIKTLREVDYAIYRVFEYTPDSINQLQDSITPPPQNYLNYKNNNLKDDCDGFHSTLLHCLKNSDIEAYLFAVNALGSGHCLILVKIQDKQRYIDYRVLSDKFDSANNAVESYLTKYNGGNDIINFGFVDYDYEKGKFYPIFKHKLL